MTGTRSHDTTPLIERLGEQIHEQLGPLLPDGPYALVDFPDHSNVGDSAIYLGEIAYFRKYLGRDPAYSCSFQRFDHDQLKRYLPRGPIFIHGGGNFGDIWDHHHNFRLEILQAFPDRQIIQLPQSIHFSSEERLRETARSIATHGNFVLMVRDTPSFELARRCFDCEVRLSPDMAFCIGPAKRIGAPEFDTLYLLRTDSERVGGDTYRPRDGEALADWIEDELFALRLAKLGGLVKGGLTAPFSHAARNFFYEEAAWSRFRRGVRLLSKADAIVTDRLHSHIISLLLGIPHAVLDNSYGKLSRFMHAWTSDAPDLFVAKSIEDASAWAAARADRYAYLPEGSLRPMEVGS
jgi:pyruvyl transferase EpsO